MAGLDEMVEPHVSGGNPLTDLYASGNLVMEQPDEVSKFLSGVRRWHEAQQQPSAQPQNLREFLGEGLTLGTMAMGGANPRVTMGVQAPKVPAFDPMAGKHFDITALKRGTVNSNYRALAPLRPQEQLEFERVSQAKGQQVLSGKYTDPYDAATLRTKEQRLQELRDLIMVRQRAKKLGIDVVDFIKQEMAKLPKE